VADTTAAKKGAIVALKGERMSNREVTDKENVAPSTVSRINRRYGKTHDFESKGAKTGRPTKLSERDIQKAVRMLSTGQAKNASDLQRKFFPRIHVDTLRNALRKRRLNAFVRQSKPLHTAAHRRKRIDLAERHCYWTGEDFRAVRYSDESKFNVFGSDGREWCWREKGQVNDPKFTKKKIRHCGGSVMVWGYITLHGVGRLHRINGIMDRFIYTDILSQSLLGTLDDHNLDRSTIYFQHNGDPKHQSKHAIGWLDLEGIDVLPWCPNSPDMNIIENL
jgi:transposase